MITCKHCGLSKDVSEFVKNKSCKKGYVTTCKKCKYKKYPPTKDQKHKAWVRNIKRYYGITPNDYNRMYEDQKGCCKVCGTQSGNTKFHIDHCHTTGKVRGLLCGPCNRALGLLNDNPLTILNLYHYISQ